MLDVLHLREYVVEKMKEHVIVPEHDYRGHHYRYMQTNTVYDSVTTKASILDNPRLKRWAANLAVEYIDRNFNVIAEASDRQAHFKAAVLSHEDTLHDAGDIGTQGHGVIERYLKEWIETGNRPPDIRTFIEGTDSRLWAITRSAELFMTDFGFEPVASEILVASPKYAFAGTLDCLAVLEKELVAGTKESLFGEHKCAEWSLAANKKTCVECGRVTKQVFALVDFKTSNSIDKPEYAMQVSAYWQALSEMTGLRPKELIVVQFDKEKMKYKVMRVQNRPAAFKAFKYVCKVYDWLNDGVSKMLPYVPKKEIDAFV